MRYKFDAIDSIGKDPTLCVLVISGSHTLFSDLIYNDIKHRDDVGADKLNRLILSNESSLSSEFGYEAVEDKEASLDLDTFLSVCNSPSPIGRWLGYTNYDILSKKDRERVKAYLKKPSPDAILVVRVSEYKNIKDLRAVRALSASRTAHYIDIQYPRRGKLSDIVRNLFEDKGFRITDDSIKLFIMKMGSSYDEYKQSIESISDLLKSTNAMFDGTKAKQDIDEDLIIDFEYEDELLADDSDAEDEAAADSEDNYELFEDGEELDDVEVELDEEDSEISKLNENELYAQLADERKLQEVDLRKNYVDNSNIESAPEKESNKVVALKEKSEPTVELKAISSIDFKNAMRGIDFFEMDDFMLALLMVQRSDKVVMRRKMYKILVNLLDNYTAREICNKLRYKVEELLYYRSYVNTGIIPVRIRYNAEKIKERLPEDSKLRKVTSLVFKRNAYLSSMTSVEDWYFIYSLLNSNKPTDPDEKYLKTLMSIMGRTTMPNDRLMNDLGIKDTLDEGLVELNGIYYTGWWAEYCRENGIEPEREKEDGTLEWRPIRYVSNLED